MKFLKCDRLFVYQGSFTCFSLMNTNQYSHVNPFNQGLLSVRDIQVFFIFF